MVARSRRSGGPYRGFVVPSSFPGIVSGVRRPIKRRTIGERLRFNALRKGTISDARLDSAPQNPATIRHVPPPVRDSKMACVRVCGSSGGRGEFRLGGG